MGFLDALRGLPRQKPPLLIDSESELEPLRDPSIEATTDWPVLPDGVAIPVETSDYDRDQWRKKLQHLVEKLPASEPQWSDLEQEAAALGFEPDSVSTAYRETFSMLIRKIVSDQVVTSEEHHKLDLARHLMGIPDDQAEVILQSIVAEAEEFFGKAVDGA